MENKSKRPVKGSQEAKDLMTFLRSKRESKKTEPLEDNKDSLPKQEPKPKSKNISVDL